jgi:predicted GTPase
MKKTLTVSFEGMDSKYGLEEQDTAILIIIKKPEAPLRVMVNEVDEHSLNALLEDFKENWAQTGMRVKQELLRSE